MSNDNLLKTSTPEEEKKAYFKQGYFVFSAIISLGVMLVIIEASSRASYGSKSALTETVKIAQFYVLIFLLASFIKKRSEWVAVVIAGGLFYFQIILVAYSLVAKKRLDFMFVSLNKGNLVDVLAPFLSSLIFIGIIAFLCSYFFVKIKTTFSSKLVLIALFFCLLIFPITKGDEYLNDVLYFAKSAYTKNEIIELYQVYREDLVAESIFEKKTLPQRLKKINTENRPKHLDNIIFLQLESVNGNLMSAEIMPNFYEISKKGMSFPNFYANGVQTILGQENLLCSLPSSFYSNLNATQQDKDVLCLPEVFNKLDYNTAFFKTYDLNFTNTGEFMQNIGFNETHMGDIMEEDDPQYTWGYREDIFFERAFSHIQREFSKEKNFLFLEVGPTNHWPFLTPEKYRKEVPFEDPKNQEERLKNTMFLQDKHLKVAFEKIDETFPEKNYTIVIVGDHSWPSGEHPGNEFCGSGPFEENFKTGMSIIFGDGKRNAGEIVENRFGHMDVMPSFLDLFGIGYSENEFSHSFFAKDVPSDDRKILLIQPFSERFLGFINQENEKYIYNSKKKELKVFDLILDKAERRPIKHLKQESKITGVFEEFFPLVKNDAVIMHALGGVDGVDYTNSKEAFEKHLKRNRILFEADVSITSDGKVVLSHEVEIKKTKEQFLKGKVRERFTPITIPELVQKMKENPQITLITDIKNKDYEKTARLLYEEIEKIDPQILARIIPETYDKSTFEFTKKEFGFEKMIYTLYKDTASDQQVFDFVKENRQNIPMVVMSKSRFNKKLSLKLSQIGVKTFVHTLNRRDEILKFRLLGAHGIFTDSY